VLNMMTSGTIFALSSGQPPAAIAIVRVSGPAAREAVQALGGAAVTPRRPTLRELRCDGELLDRALLLFFDGPATATGEDLAEFHLHGGRAVVTSVLRALSRLPGLRAAEPGEFTRRAFANGRIDLAEAEGLADLLAAETESQRRAALQLAGGALSRQVAAWTRRLLGLAAAVEAQLDFADEGDVDASLSPSWEEERRRLLAEVETFLARPPAERLRDGIRVVIAGPPNSGKSTLLNALVGREAAITSELAGTTRDLVEAPVAISGVPFLLIDSAGLRESGDVIEQIGVSRARSAIDTADLILWLGEPHQRPQRTRVLAVRAQADVRGPSDEADLSVSAVTGLGMENLVGRLVQEARQLLPTEGELALNEGQRAALREAGARIAAAGETSDLLIAAEELRQARAALDRVTGRAGVEDMLDALFDRFCIGK
jgi:tRNA modification GTPase